MPIHVGPLGVFQFLSRNPFSWNPKWHPLMINHLQLQVPIVFIPDLRHTIQHIEHNLHTDHTGMMWRESLNLTAGFMALPVSFCGTLHPASSAAAKPNTACNGNRWTLNGSYRSGACVLSHNVHAKTAPAFTKPLLQINAVDLKCIRL